jgi:hypothetical protein
VLEKQQLFCACGVLLWQVQCSSSQLLRAYHANQQNQQGLSGRSLQQ